MSKKFFRCLCCGPLPMQDIVFWGDSPAAIHFNDAKKYMSCANCGGEVEAIPEAWEREPFFSEKEWAFLFVAGLLIFVAFTVWAFGRLGGMLDLSLWFAARRP